MAKESSSIPSLFGNKVTLKLLNFAISTMLDVMDHTNFYYELSRNHDLVARLLENGITDPRLKLMRALHLALKDYKCSVCGNNTFNYECPAVVCNKCTQEYIVVCKPALEVCKMCPASDLQTCKQYKRLLLEYELEEMEEKRDEYSFVIVDGGTTTLRKSVGNLEFYPPKAPECKKG